MDVGLYGKLPTHGDFLRRRVADDFLAGWDPWLQQCLAASRAQLGEPWLDTYLTSPVWRFALPPRVCGAAAVAGLLVPSVDKVGRYFPLTLVWQTPEELSTLEVALLFRRGFEQAERLLLDTLALERFEFADFDAQVMELAVYFEDFNRGGVQRMTRPSADVLARSARPRCIPLRDASALEPPALQLFGSRLDAENPASALWWTDGSAAVHPSWLITPGLPDPASYSAMLDGAWTEAGWEVAAIEPDPTTTLVRDKVAEASAADDDLHVASAALTDPGPVRAVNQDALLERPDLRLWAVADGLGGLREGEVASRMVCDALAQSRMVAGLDEQIEVIIAQLREVNDYLRRQATRIVNPVHSGSTAAVLVIRNRECAMVWAGDSRVYRLRDALLSQLTTDHSWAALRGAASTAASDEQAVTRAVGGEDTLHPEVVRSEIRAGDRYLLCSDGVGRVLDVARLGELLQKHAPAACCADLIAHSIAAGGTDNLTAIVVDVTADVAAVDRVGL
jgi:type VI secretion system protein ImpM